MVRKRIVDRCSIVTAILAVGLSYCECPTRAEESAGASAPVERHALLVGCTTYPNSENIPELWGPANDVPAFASLLKERFGFEEGNIRQLVGWTDDPTSRPTYKNIVSEFDALVHKARPNTQIVVLMTGHGTQAPIPALQTSALDPSNPEHDGMDEVFLPADFKGWTDAGLENAIVDDQIGRWLAQLEDRGALVWIIFDCCHSGTMTKAAEVVERHRGVKPQTAGIPDSALRSAARKVEQLGERSRGTAVAEADTLDLSRKKAGTGRGGVAAFYAAQAFETAPELPRPADAPRIPENYFGLLTYMLIQTLESQEDPMTYRDLGRQVISRYRAERGSRSPTPFFSGDLDREVLGLSVFPERSSIVLERTGRITRVSAGELMGLNPGSILALYPPNDKTRKDVAILGYVRVTKVTATNSEVESCAFEGNPAVPIADFPDLAKCNVVWQELGDMRLKLAVERSDAPQTKELAAQIGRALESLPEEIAALVRQVDDSAQADWVLRVVEPKQALSRYRLRVDHPTALLVKASPGDDARSAHDSARSAAMRKVFGQYPIDEPAALVRRLQFDLQKLFSWHNTWRVAGIAAGERSRGGNYNLKLEVSRVEDIDKSESSESPGQVVFVPGDDLRVRIVNDGTSDMWVTLLYLDADFGISVWFSEALRAGKSFIDGGTIDGSSSGPEGFIVLAVPVDSQKLQPEYEFLEQDGLGVSTRDARRPPTRPLSPFEQLMSAAAFGKGKHRGLRRNTSSTPQILSWSWVTLPAAEIEEEGRHD